MNKKNRMFRSVIAMILALTLVFSMSGTAFATQTAPAADATASAAETAAPAQAVADSGLMEGMGDIDMSDIDFNELYAMMEMIYNEIIDGAYGDDAQNQTVTSFEDILTDLETYLAGSAVKTAASKNADLSKAVNELKAAIDAAQTAAASLEKVTRNDADKTAADVKSVKSAMADAVVKVAASCDKVKGINSSIGTTVIKYKNALSLLVNVLETEIFTATEDSYLVSLGDASTGASDNKGYYPFSLASYMYPDLNDSIVKVRKEFKNLGKAGMRAEDLLYILDPEFEGDDYSEKRFSSEKNKSYDDKNFAWYIQNEETDLITIGFSADTITQFTIDQISGVLTTGKPSYDVDWARYLGDEEAAELEALIADLKAEMNAMVESGLDQETLNMISEIAPPETLIDAVVAGVEGYLYVLLGYMAFGTSAVDAVAAANPDAQIALVGMYNPFEGVNLVMDEAGEPMEMGRYIGNLIRMANAIFVDHAASLRNVTYVDAQNVSIDGYDGNVNVIAFIGAMVGIPIPGYSVESKTLLPTTAGHTYIKDQIAGTLAMPNEEISNAAAAMAAVYTLPAITKKNYLEVEAVTTYARETYALLTDAEKELIGDITVLTNAEKKIKEWKNVVAFQKKKAANPKVTFSGTTVTATWGKVSGATGYTVKLYRNGKCTSTKTVKASAAAKLTWKDQFRGAKYYVKVTPYKTYAGTKYSAVTTTATAKQMPFTKVKPTISKTAAKFTVKAPDQNSTGYQIQISKGDSKFNSKDKIIKVPTNGKALKKVLKKKTYLKKGKNYVRVRPYTTLNGTTRYGNWGTAVMVKR